MRDGHDDDPSSLTVSLWENEVEHERTLVVDTIGEGNEVALTMAKV